MSSLTRERQLKRENGIKYWIDIRDFKKKTSWRCGKEIYSRTFKISESVFSISLFPNGSRREKKGHVSVILQNESSWKVKCSVTFTVKRHAKTTAGYIEKDRGWGLSKFVSHEEMDEVEEPLLNEGGGFTLEVDVDLLEEEVRRKRRRRSRRSKGDALRSLQIGVSTIKEELDNQKTEIEDIKELLNKIMQIMAANSDARRLPTVESPSLTVSS